MTSAAKRAVAGTITAASFHGSMVAAAGGFAFLAGTAIDASGGLAPEARPPEPYRSSAAAQAQAQARHLFGRLDTLLPEVGSSVADIVAIEQYVRRKVHADPYFKVATGKDYLGKAVPVAATAQVGEYVPADAVVAVTGLAVVPDGSPELVKSSPDGAAGASNRKFSEVVVAGPYMFTTLFPSDRRSGLPETARTPAWIWSGSEIGAEVRWALKELEGRLATVGASFDDIVDYTLFLTDAGDLYEFDEALRSVIGAGAPSRTVIPSLGYALPRREGAFGHADGAPRMEVQLRVRRPGAAEERRVVDGPEVGAGFQSAGVRVGPLLWLSSQTADPGRRGGDVRAEVDDALGRLDATCRNAGTDLSGLLRVRALLTSAEHAGAFTEALRAAIPSDPPAVCVVVVPSALPVTDARVAVDGVAFVAP